MMTIFATRVQRTKVIIDGNFIAKKLKKMKILRITDVIHLKRKLRTCRIQIQVYIV